LRTTTSILADLAHIVNATISSVLSTGTSVIITRAPHLHNFSKTI
jgi:hypothetical protein